MRPPSASRVPVDGADGPTPKLYRCPRCGMSSANPNDIREGYCGRCHDWTRDG